MLITTQHLSKPQAMHSEINSHRVFPRITVYLPAEAQFQNHWNNIVIRPYR